MSKRSSLTDRTPVLQNISSLVNFLRRHSPFDQMEQADLVYLVEHSHLAFYPEGDEILTPAQGLVDRLYIVKRGQVRGERLGKQGEISVTFLLTPGEAFPIGALLQERATNTVHRAATDTFCLELDRESFTELLRRSPQFQDFCRRGASSLLDRVSRHAQAGAASLLGAQNLLNAPLREIIQRPPVTCQPQTSLQTAIRRMHTEKVGSIVICDDAQRPLGIFTLHDLLALLADPGIDFNAPIKQLMTPSPIGLPADAPGFEAALAMARHRLGHICLLDGERLTGVVSERDLFALQRVDLVHLTRLISQVGSIAELIETRPQVGHLIDAMLAHGANVTLITHIITLLNDHTVQRVIELCLDEHDLPQTVEFTWLAFGSEGRWEQTLSTDQDNGILFRTTDGMTDADARTHLLPLARRINTALAQCGFPLCRGNIMAGNPELCLSEAEWRRRFSAIIYQPTPDNLLRSSIYFDFRPVWGATEQPLALYRDVVDAASRNAIFQRQMAANALQTRPPIGLIRDFILERDDNDQATLDLKFQGLTPLVDGARIMALANKRCETNTLQRLEALANAGVIRSSDADVWQSAFSLIQLLRMRNHQWQARQDAPLSNRLDPEMLHEIDRRSLKEAFRQTRRFQRRLELDYQL